MASRCAACSTRLIGWVRSPVPISACSIKASCTRGGRSQCRPACTLSCAARRAQPVMKAGEQAGDGAKTAVADQAGQLGLEGVALPLAEEYGCVRTALRMVPQALPRHLA